MSGTEPQRRTDGQVGPGSWSNGLLLFGFERRWLDALVTAAVAAFLVWSRFALLANGPWEWDETLFARGIFKFNLAAHFPHPPGFPGWLAIGRLLLPVAGTPLRALQIASAFLSVAALWPLTALGRRVAAPAVAVAGALLVLVLPGPWLHAVRGFSSTPATTLALGAGALLVGGLAGRRATWFTLLVAAAFLVRPILLPGLAVLWLGGVWTVRPRRRLLPGVAAALALGLVALIAMVHAQGGVAAFLEAFEAHASRHFSHLVHNPGGPLDLGLVKGAGGPVWTVALGLLAALGLVVWARRVGRRGAALWIVVLAVTTAQVVLLQNRTYSRYAVPVQIALGPLVAGGAAAVASPAVAVGGLLVLALTAASGSRPLLVEQHTSRLPGWAAVDTGLKAARDRGWAVVSEGGLHPFASYRWFVEGRGKEAEEPPLVLSPWDPDFKTVPDRPWLVVTDHPGWYLPGLWGPDERWGGVSPGLVPLTQGRFLEAAVIGNPPLPVGRWWHPESKRSGERFMWGSAGAAVMLPPLPAGTWAGLDLRPASGREPLVVRVDGAVAAEVDGRARRGILWLSPDRLSAGRTATVAFDRDAVYPPSGGDTRPLALQLFGIRAVGPRVPWGGPVASDRDRARLRIELEGAYGPERVAGIGRGCWLRPGSRLRLPAGEGTVTLLLSAPRATPPEAVVRVGGTVLASRLELISRPRAVAVDVRPAPGVRNTELVIDAVPFVPAREGAGGDTRELGVFLLEVHYRPAGGGPASGLRRGR